MIFSQSKRQNQLDLPPMPSFNLFVMKRRLKYLRSTFSLMLAFHFAFASPAEATPTVMHLHQAVKPVKLSIKEIAQIHTATYGWGVKQFACLDALWTSESHWNYKALNHSSGAFGIPQALPASKMASAGLDWRTNPITQIKWGAKYISLRYGTPCSAWNFKSRTGYY